MRRRGILHGELSAALARLGHTDRVVVADCGLPIPAGPQVIDLAFSFGVPTFLQVLDGLLAELVVESAVVATEIDGSNPSCASALADRLPQARRIPHEELKWLLVGAKLVVRTGEASPYANVVLRCGVPF
ncbi:D-ribose pyranase [Allokutzneria sp. A3M-2-11 16]|uniref:D-ribose pyranase n=1 Tax=Allokutzneria sp. A3M-2-11 16 TaxID=2962043 RepID=UPI0020B7D5D0|nr:D-ribose pyranase [Allokutzneria sp. A3M-2-11 16]MCP3799465.1 D-ribose pyranase [Allokutzneria sp. A3M-2-11 16]